MARDIGKRLKRSRRAGTDLGFTLRSAESKCRKRLEVPPGQHGTKRGRQSNYAIMLREKQKVRQIYGMLERQFKRFFEKAKTLKGSTGDNLIKLLESRLDNVVYRMGFASTRAEARQLVSHRCVLVNGAILNIPSYLVPLNSVIEIKDRSKKQLRVLAALEKAGQVGFPEWVDVNPKDLKGTYLVAPGLNEMQSLNLNLVVEYYSQ